MLDSEFLRGLKQATEAKWRVKPINPTIYGFQFQQGTRWKSGLSNEQVADYERALRVLFPTILKPSCEK
jgi:hypothetical protein